MSDFHFVLVTSDRCPHCTVFKSSILPSLQNEIIFKYKNVQWIHINLPNYDFVETGYPKGIKNIIGWFPIMLLIPSDLWDRGDLTDEYDRIKIFNGKIQTTVSNITNLPKVTVVMTKDYDPNLNGIKKWLDTYVASKKETSSMQYRGKMRFKRRERRLIKYNY
jgi:hypothetical protein